MDKWQVESPWMHKGPRDSSNFHGAPQVIRISKSWGTKNQGHSWSANSLMRSNEFLRLPRGFGAMLWEQNSLSGVGSGESGGRCIEVDDHCISQGRAVHGGQKAEINPASMELWNRTISFLATKVFFIDGIGTIEKQAKPHVQSRPIKFPNPPHCQLHILAQLPILLYSLNKNTSNPIFTKKTLSKAWPLSTWLLKPEHETSPPILPPLRYPIPFTATIDNIELYLVLNITLIIITVSNGPLIRYLL